MIAPVLHLDEPARAAIEAVDQMPAVSRTVMTSRTTTRGRARELAPQSGVELVVVADHVIDLGHRGVGLGPDLRAAPVTTMRARGWRDGRAGSPGAPGAPLRR